METVKHKINIDWDFRGEETRALTHCFHDYPARMIPQIASNLLHLFGGKAQKLFDPYCGTGTSLVEAQIKGVDAIGTDLNPLACLIAKVKTTPISRQTLDSHLKEFNEYVLKLRFGYKPTFVSLPVFSNIDFWFQQDVIKELAIIKEFIWQIKNENIRDYFKVAFSETVRESSLTRNGEFKLFRMSQRQIEKFEPDVYEIMEEKLSRNKKGMLEYLSVLDKCKKKARVSVLDFNSVEGIPDSFVGDGFDILITSPPYGDSHTTVAYGQYSRLSNQWMDIDKAGQIDKKLMGGQINGKIPIFDCKVLDIAIEQIANEDEKRAKEIVSFYIDLEKSIINVSRVIKRGGYTCYVVGNRRVKGITLPTDKVIVSFFERNGFTHVDTFVRNIPNKRMPIRNSPTNEPGKLDTTMVNEYIVVMKKEK